jgi:hypothetical protein
MNLEAEDQKTRLAEQCENLSFCLERLTWVIERNPGRKDLYVLRTMLEDALTKVNRQYLL